MEPYRTIGDRQMPSITIKNIPDDLYKRLKTTASVHHRSINSEVIHCLELVLKPRKVEVEERLTRIRTLRDRASAQGLNETEIAKAITKGRP